MLTSKEVCYEKGCHAGGTGGARPCWWSGERPEADEDRANRASQAGRTSALGEEGGLEMIASIYARLSSEDERSGIDGASVERQIENARAFAASRRWTV